MKTVGVICRNHSEFQHYVHGLYVDLGAGINIKQIGYKILLNNAIEYIPLIYFTDLDGLEFSSIVILERIDLSMIVASMNRIRH